MANPAIFRLSQALAYTVVSNGSFLAPYFWRPFAPCFGSTLLVRPVYLLTTRHLSSLRQSHLPHQLCKPWVGMQRVE
jgi:hypothetical protein